MNYKIQDQNGLYFLTFTLVDWVDLFTRPIYAEIILDSLKYCQKEKDLMVHAYVIMPSHLHLILSTSNEKGLSQIIQSFKSYTAKAIIRYLEDLSKVESRRYWILRRFEFNARTNKRDSKYQIWRRDNHPVILFSPKAIRTNLNYIHNNPIVSGFVESEEHYRYSSASNYTTGSGLIDVDILDDIYIDVGYINC